MMQFNGNSYLDNRTLRVHYWPRGQIYHLASILGEFHSV